MRFLNKVRHDAEVEISQRIIDELRAGKSVLWLTCGGSNIPSEVRIMQFIAEGAAKLTPNLFILPMDERYGPSGHTDSNYKQLLDAGFDPSGALWLDILEKNLTLAETVKHYTDLLDDKRSKCAIVVGVFGLGTDGHTAGVLPNSPATYETNSSVVGYSSSPFKRITLTETALEETDVAYVLAYGDNKKEIIQRLYYNRDIRSLPAGLFYKLAEVYVYNDYVNNRG